ncbi:MAG: hypothetical protein ACREVG_02185, partial [Burkholderiales bacterium]
AVVSRLSLFAGAATVVMAASVAAQSLPTGSFQVAQATSCQSWFDTCASRCKVSLRRGPQV